MAKANISYAVPVETISRKFTLRKNKAGGANNGRFFVGNAHDTAAYGGITVARVSVRFNARNTPPTAKEMALHTQFRTIQRAVTERIGDLMVMTQDQAAYSRYRQKYGDRFKYGSIRMWLVGMGFALWNESKHTVDWPTDNNWPENMPGYQG
jgi:hypothetical protein